MIIFESSHIEEEYFKFKSFLVKQIKRDLTPQEDIHIAEGIIAYINSGPATNERTAAMKYLFNLEFLT